MIKRWLTYFGVGLLLVLVQVVPAAAIDTSEGGGGGAGSCRTGVAEFLGFNSWDSCLGHTAEGVPILRGLADIWYIAVVIIDDFLKVCVYVAIGFIVWGGVKYLKSQGDPGETTQARQIIHNSLFGLIITILAVAIVNFTASTF